MPLQIDNLTLLLLALFLALLLYSRFSRPSPLVHPLLLGKQSEVSAVRKEGETGVYRSFATGQGTPLVVRPAGALKTAQDIVKTPPSNEPGAAVPRCILDTSLTDEALAEILRIIPLGLRSVYSSLRKATPESPSSILILLPPSRTASLPLLLLALKAPPNCPLIILPTPHLLTAALTAKEHPNPGVIVVHESLAEDVMEQAWEDLSGTCGVCIFGDPDKMRKGAVMAAKEKGMDVAWWADLWDAGDEAKREELPSAGHADVHSYFYTETSTDPAVVKVTHLNITAGIAGVLALFPADKRPSGSLRDVVASCVSLNTPFGLTVALASVYSGAGFRLIGRKEQTWDDIIEDPAGELTALMDKADSQPKPTILFISCKHHRVLLERLHSSIKYRPFVRFGVRQKADGLFAGHVSRGGAFDEWSFGLAREMVLGGVAGKQLRAVVVVGDAPPSDILGMSHVLLGLPLIRLHPSFYSTGPVFVSHYYDVQSQTDWANLWHSTWSKLEDEVERIEGKGADTTEEKKRAHVGPPASNVEVVLRGVGQGWDAQDGAGAGAGAGTKTKGGKDAPIKGEVWVRGPGVVSRLGKETAAADGWVDIGEIATVQTNGTFVVLGKSVAGIKPKAA